MNVQFKKGVLELLVLAVVSTRDRYGYELVEAISRHIGIAEGTIYPLLRRLQVEGYFETYLQESAEGPPRKYYKLTAEGRRQYEAMRAEWREFAAGVNAIIEEGNGDSHASGRLSKGPREAAGEAT
jgi:PadR family transcriptional regulator PadR